jgi:hypothetical protein
MVHCNECNETRDAARAIVRDSRRLVFVAENALKNGDLARARTALGELKEALTVVGGDSERHRSSARRFR